jgi:hypothetical protein
MVVLVLKWPHYHYRIDTTDTNMLASITAARPAPVLCLHLLVPHLSAARNSATSVKIHKLLALRLFCLSRGASNPINFATASFSVDLYCTRDISGGFALVPKEAFSYCRADAIPARGSPPRLSRVPYAFIRRPIGQGHRFELGEFCSAFLIHG